MKKSKEKITPEKFIGHLNTVSRHKYLVMKGCFSVGLYRQGIMHDLSKFSPTEFMVGARYWQGNRSPTVIPVKMPGRYVVEMLMDRIAASKVYAGEDYDDSYPLKYFERGTHVISFMHPETAALLHKLLLMLAEEGEEKTFAYVRRHLHK